MTGMIRNILKELEQVREDLLSLSDDIWLNIDHNDNDAVREGVEFKLKYNEKMAAFDRLSEELSSLIQQFTQVSIEPEPVNTRNRTAAAAERMIQELDTHAVHSLDENFTYKRPYGFKLGDLIYKDLTTWRWLYELLCSHLSEHKPEVFKALPDNPDFVSRKGNFAFSKNPDDLRSAVQMPFGVYAEVNLSANGIRNNIKQLLSTFQVNTQELVIFLREDRDASCEERS